MRRQFKRLSPVLALCAALLSADPVIVSCSPDTPVAETDSTITVRAFAPDTTLHYVWNPAAGSISEEQAEAHWKLAGVAPGIYRATVEAQGSSTAKPCSFRVVVTEKIQYAPLARGSEAGSAFLLRGQIEENGYGLYSYLLLGAPPIDATRDRYLKVIDAYLHLIPALEELRQNIRPRDLNATYLLLESVPPKDISAEWVLEHYDYARARAFLRLLRRDLRVGPYFLSSTNPLAGTEEIARPYLFQDMSTVPAVPKELASWWVREFMNQSAQQRFWDTRNAMEFTLKLRNTLAVLSAGLPDVRDSVKEWVSWIS